MFRMDEENDDIHALQNKVHKLDSILEIYRDKFGNLPTDPEEDDNDTEVPWFVDRKVLSPILNDYDNMISELLKQKDNEGSDVRQLVNLVKKLMEENKRLKVRLAHQMHDDDNDDTSQESSHHIQSPSSHHLRSRVNDLEKINEELERKHKASEAEIASCRWQIQELRSTLNQLRGSDSDFKVIAGRSTNDSAFISQIEQLKHLLRNHEARLEGKSNHASDLEEEKMQLMRQVEQLKRKVDEVEHRDAENLEQMKKNKQLVEAALVERDQFLIKEKQAQEEVSRLQTLVEKVVEDAGLKSRQEVEKVRSEYKMRQEKMEFQLQRYREENSESKSQVDRLTKDKLSLQDELKSILERLEECEGTKRCKSDDVMMRTFAAERLRDEADLKVEMLKDKLSTSEREHKKEKERLMEEFDQVKERLLRCLTELDRVTEDREKLVSEVCSLKMTTLKLEANKDASMRHLAKQLLVLQQSLKTKEKEYEARLSAIEEEHRSSLLNLKDSMTGQHRVASKLKEETNTMIAKLELEVTHLKGELTSEKKEKMEALKLLKSSRDKTRETELKMSAFSKNMEILESRLYDVENEHDTKQNQISRRDNLIRGLSVTDARRSEMRDIQSYLNKSNL